eukprot:gene11378-11527_t
MYKRKFQIPLHRPPAAATSGNEQHAGYRAHGQQDGSLAAESSSKAAELSKENKPPVLLLEKQKPFIAPTTGTRPACGLGVSVNWQHKPGEPSTLEDSSEALRVFAVLYTKREKAMKKKDRGFADGILHCGEKGCTLFDIEGKVITTGKAKLPGNLESGMTFELGNLVLEYDQELSVEDFKRGKCFTEACKLASATSATPMLALKLTASSSTAAHLNTTGKANHITARRLHTTLGSGSGLAMFDPNAPDALVLNAAESKDEPAQLQPRKREVPVVVDPYIAKHLRPHQREGVVFMYECCMGLRDTGGDGAIPSAHGCLLADEMGLGKTLQVIALLWTLLRQGPQGAPVCNKAVVVAPATLVANWGRELKKWLGEERLKFMQLSQGPAAAEQVTDFKLGKVWKLLVGSYEGLRKYGAQLKGCCDVLVCDEGHRLKSTGGNKTITALLEMDCTRRIVLTGTPVQNNLDEFYALLSFACPGILGSPSVFRRVYGDPITRSRDKDASTADKELGAARAEELQRKVACYVLRRTQDVLRNHLPPLAMHTIFCKPSNLQVYVYKGVLSSRRFASLLSSTGSADPEGVLPAITLLRKLCNHPKLLLKTSTASAAAAAGKSQTVQNTAHPPTSAEDQQKLAEVAETMMQQHIATAAMSVDAIELSGKLLALSALLEAVMDERSRMVIVSTSTTALDLINDVLCRSRGWLSVRIDGSTSVDERQTIVDNFNLRNIGQVFLLSTRAGGAGLNLIGANHLVLYDSDWNPAMDKQAMARIWRDGQQKPCHVYRLLTTGTIEEKVYQRQMMKSDLAGATMQSGTSVANLSHSDLKELFTLDADGGVAWFTFPSKSSADDASINKLPPVLRAAERTGAVTAISKEGTAGPGTEGLQNTSAGTEAACGDGQQEKKRFKRTYSSESMDVSCLEIEMAS